MSEKEKNNDSFTTNFFFPKNSLANDCSNGYTFKLMSKLNSFMNELIVIRWKNTRLFTANSFIFNH